MKSIIFLTELFLIFFTQLGLGTIILTKMSSQVTPRYNSGIHNIINFFLTGVTATLLTQILLQFTGFPYKSYFWIIVHAFSLVVCFSTYSKYIYDVLRYFKGNAFLLLSLLCLIIFYSIYVNYIYYPGSTIIGYGDLVSYYRVAQNIHTNSPQIIDFIINDYANNTYNIPVMFPLLSFFSSTYLYLFYSSTTIIMSFISVSLLLLFCATFIDLKKSLKTTPLCFFAFFFFFWSGPVLDQALFGAFTFPTALISYHLSYLYFYKRDNIVLDRSFVSLLLLNFLSSSIGGVLTITLLSIAAIKSSFLKLSTLKLNLKSMGLLIIAVIGIALGTKYALNILNQSSLGRMTYNIQTRQFEIKNKKIISDNIQINLGISQKKQYENVVLDNFTKHPFSFSWFIIDLALSSFYKNYFLLSLYILVFLSLISLLLQNSGYQVQEKLLFLCAILTFFIVLVCLNNYFGFRHLIPVIFLTYSFLFNELTLIKKLGNGFLSLFILLLCFSFTIKKIFFLSSFLFYEYLIFTACCLAILIIFFGNNVSKIQSRKILITLSFALLTFIVEDNYYGLRMVHRFYTSPHFNPYKKVYAKLKKIVPPNSLIASSYPQLTSYMLDSPAVGNVHISTFFNSFVNMYKPDFVLIDKLRDGPKNYSIFKKNMEMNPSYINQYEVVFDSPPDQYMILKRK